MLGEFGANVVKVYGPQRRIGGGYLNRGKRTILLDVESTEGQKVLWKLLDHTDVVIVNFPPGTAERYGIGFDQLRARKPDLIYASLSCLRPRWTVDAGRGYERQGQAVTGVMHHVGDVPAILGPYNLVDIGTGVLTAFAVGLAVYHRARTGQGQQVFSSLSQTAMFHQTPWMLDYAGKEWTEPRGWEATGTGPLHRFYQAQDGWFFLGARATDAAVVHETLGLPSIEESALERCFVEATRRGLGRALPSGRHRRARRRRAAGPDARPVGPRARPECLAAIRGGRRRHLPRPVRLTQRDADAPRPRRAQARRRRRIRPGRSRPRRSDPRTRKEDGSCRPRIFRQHGRRTPP